MLSQGLRSRQRDGKEEKHALHRKHGLHEELEAAHADPAGGAVLVELHRAEIVA